MTFTSVWSHLGEITVGAIQREHALRRADWMLRLIYLRVTTMKMNDLKWELLEDVFK